MDYGALSLLPPLVSIALALLTKEVVFSLFGGVFVWQMIKIGDFSPFGALYGSIEAIVGLFAEGWVVKSIVFIVLVGSILTIVVESGGVSAFVRYLTERSNRVKSKKGALLLGYFIGITIFIESTITSLVVGSVTAPLADRFGASRAKVAYLCDATSAPVCSLIPLNGWGALLTGLVSAQIAAGVLTGNAASIVASSIVFNFYAIITVVFAFLIIYFDFDFSYMKKSEDTAKAIHGKNIVLVSEDNGAKVSFMVLPIVFLTVSSILFLTLSGGGDIWKGSGTTAVFYAVLSTLAFCFVYFVVWHKHFKSVEYFAHLKNGSMNMMYVGVMMTLAFAISAATKDLGTGTYLAGFAKGFLNPSLLPAVIFVFGCMISFSTGTSWGTFSIMVPIAISMGVALGVDISLVIGAAVAGGVFGDHCSPISDTTIVSSTASGCDLMEHVKTQLPYAFLCGFFALLCFISAGFIF